MLHALILGSVLTLAALQESDSEAGFVPLFDGKDLSQGIIPEGDNGHWKVLDSVLDYDARSEAPGNKNLVSKQEFEDFILRFEWRIKETPLREPEHPLHPPRRHPRPRRPRRGVQVHAPRQRLGSLPPRLEGQEPGQHLVLADRLGRGLRLSDGPEHAPRGSRGRHAEDAGRQAGRQVELVRDHPDGRSPDNRPERQDGHRGGHAARLPTRGPIALQHHRGFKDGKYLAPPSLMQFRKIRIKPLKAPVAEILVPSTPARGLVR